MRIATTEEGRGRRALRGLALLGLAALGAPAMAQAPAAAGALAAQEEAPDDEKTRTLKRVLFLRNGQILRSKARYVDGCWEVQSDGRSWTGLPAGMVERAELERDLMRELGRRRKQVDADDLPARVALAEWMVRSGLRRESLQELDVVLRKSPDLKPALAVLERNHYAAVPSLQRVDPDELEQRKRELLSFAAGAPTAVQHLAASELGRLDRNEELKAELAAELTSGSIRRRAFATLALRRLFPGQHLQPLMVHAVLDTCADVRLGAACALRTVDEPAMVVPVARAMHDSSVSQVRLQAVETLGNMGYPAAVQPLMSRLSTLVQAGDRMGVARGSIFIGKQFAYIQDFDVEVAQFQAVADPQVNVLIEGSATTAGAVATVSKGAFLAERAEIRKSLRKLTGEDAGNDSQSWLDWWEENKHEWVSARHSGENPRAPSTPGG